MSNHQDSKIIKSIKKEVALSNNKKQPNDKNVAICGDLGCSDSSGCSTYCSES